MDRLKILVVIAERRTSDKLTESLEEFGARLVSTVLGKGTAKSEIVSLLGLGETEKTVILSCITEGQIGPVFDMLKQKYRFSAPGKGIAFTIPVSAVGGPATLRLMSGQVRR